MNEKLLEMVEKEVLGWPGIWKKRDENGIGGVGVTGYRLGERQIGHIHHDGVADVQFPRATHDDLIANGKAEPHRGGFPAVVSYRINAPEDVPGLVELLRMSYERVKATSERKAERQRQPTKEEHIMEKIASGLYASKPEPLGFGPSLEIRAYLLRRERGNLLVYRSATLEEDTKTVNELGGVSRQYLNHHHEASPATDRIAKTFDAPLHIHEEDAAEASERSNVDETFTERHMLDDDFEVVPTPGHTSGATAFLWDTGEHRVLFTGDTLFFVRGRWRAAVLDGVSDREKYIESLELIRSLDFDLVAPGIAPAGEPFYEFVEKAEAERRIDDILERLRRGEDG